MKSAKVDAIFERMTKRGAPAHSMFAASAIRPGSAIAVYRFSWVAGFGSTQQPANIVSGSISPARRFPGTRLNLYGEGGARNLDIPEVEHQPIAP